MLDRNTGGYSEELMTISNVGAVPGGDAFLITTKGKAALIDSGFSFCAEEMIENIKSVLGNRSLDYVLLTHSHYDHASGSAYCSSHFKDVKIVASEYAAKILSKPSAIAVMREMNESAALHYGYPEWEDKLDELKVDVAVSEGDKIDLGDISLQVIEAPGHTRCSIAFYIPEAKMLIGCETSGCLAGEHLIAPCFLVGYEISIAHIKRMMSMDIEKILVPHQGVVEGAACRDFPADSLRSSELLRDIIIEDYSLGKTQEEITEHYKQVFYTPAIQRLQPPKAFYLNASYIVPMVLKEVLKQ